MGKEFHCRVFTGMGKGAYYVGHPGFSARFRDVLGYTPFPGTLNLRTSAAEEIEARRKLRMNPGNSIERFQFDGEIFSAVKCYNGRLNGVDATLTIPEITEYDDSVLEIIAAVKLRDRLHLTDGQLVTVSVDEELIPGVNGH